MRKQGIRQGLAATMVGVAFSIGLAAGVAEAFTSVLEVVPADAYGFVRVRNIRELSADMDRVAGLVSAREPKPKDVLAHLLARLVGAGFASDEELERLGLDLDQDFAFAFLSTELRQFTAIAHVSNQPPLRAILLREGMKLNRDYRGVAYAESGGRTVAFIDDVLVFSTAPDVIRRIIDTAEKSAPSVLVSPRLAELGLLDADGPDDVTAYLDVEAIETPLLRLLLSLAGDAEGGGTQHPRRSGFGPTVARWAIPLVPELRSYGASLRMEDGDLRWHEEGQYREGSARIAATRAPNRPFTAFDRLPADAVFAGATNIDGEASRVGIRQGYERLFGQATDAVVGALRRIAPDYADQIGFAARFRNAAIPEVVAAVPLRGHDPDAVADAILAAVVGILSPNTAPSALTPRASAATWGDVKGVTFSLQAGALASMPPQMALLFPRKLGFWWGVDGGDLLVSLSADADPLEWLVQARREGPTLKGDESIAALAPNLPDSARWVVYLSPARFIQAYSGVLRLVLPQAERLYGAAGALKGVYSLGLSSANRSEGKAFTMVIRVADWQPIFDMYRMLLGPEDAIQ